MENRTYNYPFSAADVAYFVKCMKRFVRYSEQFSSTPFCLLIKNTCIGITVFLHTLLRLSGYYEYNEK